MTDIRFRSVEECDHADERNRVRLVLEAEEMRLDTELTADNDYELLMELAKLTKLLVSQ
jgi:hypothetical protein